LLKEIGGFSVLVEFAGLILGDPDADQVARQLVPPPESMQAFARDVFLRNLALERDAVGTVSGQGFHPLEAQHARSILKAQSVRPQGRTPSGVNIACRFTI
jgi:hypothetical protein